MPKSRKQPSDIPYDPNNPPTVGIEGKPLPKNHFKRLARHEAGHMLLNWLIGNRPCGAMLAANGEAYTMSEKTDDSLIAVGLVKIAGFVASQDKRNLRSIRANWNKPKKFAMANDCFWVTSIAQHILDGLAPNLGLAFIEAAIQTVEEVCQTYHEELAMLANILEKRGYIKYQESEMLFNSMGKLGEVKCPDWVIERCMDYIEIVLKEREK